MRVLSVVARCGLWIILVILVFGRRWVWPEVADARRNLSGVCRRWYPVVLILHRFFIAVSRAVVNCDDSSGLTPHPLVWSAGGLPEGRRIEDVIRDVTLLPGPLHLWDSGWISVPPVAVTAEDVCLWPAGDDLGPGGIPTLSSLFFMSFGLVKGFSLRKLFLAVRWLIAQFQCRLFLLVQALIFGDLVRFLVQCCVRYVLCLVALAGFFLVLLVPTIVGYGTLVGLSLVTASLPDLVRLLISGSLMSCFFSLVTPWVWGCLAAWDSAFEVLYVSSCT